MKYRAKERIVTFVVSCSSVLLSSSAAANNSLLLYFRTACISVEGALPFDRRLDGTDLLICSFRNILWDVFGEYYLKILIRILSTFGWVVTIS